jgi:hypothetical protein
VLPKVSGAETLLFRRLFLGRRLLPSLAIPFTIGMVFTATYWVANGFALSGQQIAQRELGHFDHAVALDVAPGDLGRSSLARVDGALRAKGVGESAIGITSTDVRPDQLNLKPTAGPQRVLSFTETASPKAAFPGRYHLVSGRWPRAPGEVILSPALRHLLPSGDFSAFGGVANFRVVGTFNDRFDTDATAILAAPGTWEEIPASTAKAFAPQGALVVMWAGSAAASTIDSVTRGVLALAPPPGGDRPATDRAVLVQSRDQSLSDSQRLLFAYPLGLLSAMAGIAVVRSNRRWSRAYVRRCQDLGLPPRRVGSAITAALAGGVIAAGVAGIAAGAIVGWVIRRGALSAFLTQPVGPMRSLSPVIVAALVMSGLTLLVCAFDVLVTGARRQLLDKIVNQVPWALVRRVLAALAALHGIQVANRSTVHFDDLGGTGVLITAAAVLLAPDVLSVARLGLSRRRPQPMIARRMIEADRGGLALVSMIVAASVAFPVTMNSYNASSRLSNDAGFVGMARPHQLWIDGTTPTADPRPVVFAVATEVSEAPIELRTTNAFVYPAGGKPVENTGIATVPNASDLVKLLGDEPWVRQMTTYVSGGGVAFLDGPARPIHSRDPKPRGEIDLPKHAFGAEPSDLAAPFAGVMLASTARKVGLASTPLANVFTGLSQTQIDASIAAVRDAGLDIRLLSFYTPKQHTKPTAQSYFALGGLLILASFLLIGLMRAAGERMRERAGQLLAVGFRRRWSASVAALQLGMAVLSGLAMGALGAAAAVWVFVLSPAQAMLLDIPTGFITLTLVLVVTVSLIGIATCVSRVRAQPDTEL